MDRNPFTPSFGTLPVAPVGREPIIAEMQGVFRAFDPSDIHWATHLRAHRGAGKTVLLDQIQDLAVEHGWWVIQEDGGAGAPLPRRIIDRCLARLEQRTPPPRGPRVTGIRVMGSGISVERGTPPGPPSVTSVRDSLAAVAAVEPNGVLLTIDEVHHAPDDAVNEIGNAAQHLHRDGHPFVLVVAGLPQPARRREPTFLARAARPILGRLSDGDVERGLLATARSRGGTFEPIALRRAIDAIAGEPFLLQLVGYHSWRQARRSPITADDVGTAVPRATEAYNRAVTIQILDDISPDQRSFLAAMVRHGSPTRIADVRADTGWSSSQANVYRRRLLDAGLIAAVGYGLVEFALPGIQDVLAEDL